MSTVTAVIAAAGASSRMGFDKLSYRLGAHTVLEQSVLAMDRCPEITSLVLVCSASGQCAAEAATCLCQKPVRIVRGGATRAQSVRAGVLAADGEYVAIHDAARPFVSGAVVRAAVCAAQRCGAAAPAVPVKDTIKIVQSTAAGEQDLLVEKTPDRSTLYAVQTPQCFLRSAYLEALGRLSPEKADLVTDDCSLFELAGLPVQLVPGDYANCKITTREDLAPFAAKETAGMHIGHGYDVHRLVEGRPLILGGVEIPFEKGLLGHSDADVLTHAVMDAVLGAAAQGDIGQHFPDTDPAYAGADSLALARAVAALTTQKGWRIVNLDATILCQRPKLAGSIPQMRANLAEAFGLSFEDVSVKATTEEHLGFTGEGLGIAAHAVALLEKL